MSTVSNARAAKTLIMKFGGSSVGNVAALTQVLSIVLHERTQWDKLILVVSALDGVTDALIEATHLAQLANSRGYRRIAAQIRARHLSLIEKLALGANERASLNADIDRLLFDMLNLCQSISDNTNIPTTPDTIDAVLGVGEKLSARILAALLRQNGLYAVALDTIDLIVTDDVHGHATPNWELTRNRIETNLLPMLERNIIPVLTGFIGGTQSGKPTTLGRGGSDYTASILSVCCRATETWIWTDVDGIMSCDPREIPDAHVIPELSYEEMAELAYFGARVLHARMVAPLHEHRIPLRVKNVYKPQQAGTLIHAIHRHTQLIIAVTAIQGLGLSCQRSGSLAQIIAVVDEVFFQTVGSRVEVMFLSQSSQSTFVCFVIPTTAGADAVHTLQTALEARVIAHPHEKLSHWHVSSVSVISAIGTQINGYATLNSRVMGLLGQVRILAMSQSPAQVSLSVVVETKDLEQALRLLHPLTQQSLQKT